ncbi:MAG: TonB-dependent receptor [Gammaproteobacteria bacterium]|nr:TonB-dependent receptor [Gammaproteobacteria bacterium]
MKTFERSLAVALGLSLGCSASGAFAQSNDLVIEEILVTAQKREQSLQDVPISVSVITGQKLVEAGIENLDDLALYVPNFSKSETGIGPVLQIRGIATGNNPGFEQSVVMYMDDIALGRGSLARMPFMDLERVEVLRGPQNVLFGKNSIAGAISMITAKPTDEMEGSVSVRYGDEYDDSEIVGVLSGPLTEGFRGRIAVRQAERGGYALNAGNGRNEEQREETAVRATFALDVRDEGELTLKYEHDTVDSKGMSQELMFEYGNPLPFDPVLNPFAGFTYTQQVATLEGIYNQILAGAGAPPISVGSDTAGIDRIRRSNVEETQDLDLDHFVLTYNEDFDGLSVTSVTGFSQYKETRLTGSSSGIDISSILSREEYKQFSQELRFTSDLDGPMSWIAGAYFQRWELEADESTLVDEMNMPVLLGLMGFAPGLESVANLDSTRYFTSDSMTLAAFGQVTWSVSDAARISLGGRYTREKKSGRRFIDIFNTSTGAFDATQAIFASCAFGVDYQSLGVLSDIVPLPGCDGVPAFGSYSRHDTSGERTENAITPSVIGELDVGDDSMVFLSYSTGFKAGGFDARAGRQSDLEYEDEGVDNFELGYKASLADGRAQVNLVAYHSKYKDRQVTTFDGIAGFVVGNAAEAKVQGFEFDGRWRATEGLTLSGSVAYMDYETTKYPDAPCSAIHTLLTGETLCDRAGRTATYVPDWSASLIADYVLPITGNLDIRSTFDVLYESEYFTDSGQDVNLKQDAYTMYNVRLALESESWALAVLGKNLSDEDVIEFSSVVPLSGSSLSAPAFAGFLQPPRTVAVQFEYRF